MKTFQIKCKLTKLEDYNFLWNCSNELCDYYTSMMNTLRIDFEIKSQWPTETRSYISNYELQKQYSAKRLKQKPKYLMSWQIIGVADQLYNSIKGFFVIRKTSKIAKFPFKQKDKSKFQPLYFSFQKNSKNIKILSDNEIELTFQNKKKIVLKCCYNVKKFKLTTLKILNEGHKLVFKDGEFYFHLCTDNDKKQLETTNKSIYIDLGQKNLVMGYVPETNTIIKVSGRKLKSPKLTKKKENIQSRFDRKKRNSIKKRKLKKTLTRLQKKETNLKKTFLHKVSRKLINDYDSITVGDLTNIKNNTKSDNKNINKYKFQFWPVALFVNMLNYKAQESSNRSFKKVNESQTTKKCCNCGQLKIVTLSERVYKCTNCKIEIDRDSNSAINIYKKTLQLEPKLNLTESILFDSVKLGALRTEVLEVK